MTRLLSEDKVLIAAHRGVAGGNIPCNTLPDFEAALRQGADIIELDVTRSMDGQLFIFHPGKEAVFLRTERSIERMESREVERLPLMNQDQTPTKYHVPRLEEALKLLRGRCLINLDKFWMWPEEITALVRELGMQDQVLIKTNASEQWFRVVEEIAPDLPYMTIAHERDDVTETLLRRPLRYAGIEAIFTEDSAPIAAEDYLAGMRKAGLFTWANAIVYDDQVLLTAGHTDDLSVAGRPADGWGWLADRGFSILQTDWPMALSQYFKERNAGREAERG